MNGLWIMITIVCLGGVMSEMYKYKVKMESGERKKDAACDALAERLAQVEGRLANIESLVVEIEKQRDFDRAL